MEDAAVWIGQRAHPHLDLGREGEATRQGAELEVVAGRCLVPERREAEEAAVEQRLSGKRPVARAGLRAECGSAVVQQMRGDGAVAAPVAHLEDPRSECAREV